MASCLKKFSTLIICCQATSWSMSSVLPSLICMASRCKHAQLGFPLRTANMCNFLLQREQDTMLPLILSHPMFLREIGSRQTKKRAALSFLFGLAGLVWRWLFSLMHLWQAILANQDAFPRWKSSLSDISCKSGCISPLEIIPHRHFLLIRMNFSVGIHPSQTFPANQDEFPHWKSSLSDISCESGWIFSLKIIPHRHFLLIRMHFSAGNHPSQTFPANQDEFHRKKSSLDEHSCKSGWISAVGNHPSQAFLANQDEFPRWKSSLSDISC